MAKLLKIAVLSDLHCHPSDIQPSNTVLYTDALRLPSKEHPVENLLDLIGNEQLDAHVVMCPGDFAHQANRQGLLSGWSFVNEISTALKNAPIISTIGNHDVDSRNNSNSYSFNDVKKVSRNFPVKEEYLESYWSKGFSVIIENDYIVLVINSCFFHTHADKKVINHGEIDKHQLEQIESSIKEFKDDGRIKILLLHHHPVQHERFDLGDEDFLKNGEDLMKIIVDYNFDLVIHGHKHDPWLRYYTPKSSVTKIPILSSGSFSATNQKLYTEIGNYFHMIEIFKDEKGARGKVISFRFKIRSGWSKSENDFYTYSGFGSKLRIEEIVQSIKEKVSGDKRLIKWSEIANDIVDLEYLLPEEIDALKDLLKTVNIGFPQLGTSISLDDSNVIYYYGS